MFYSYSCSLYRGALAKRFNAVPEHTLVSVVVTVRGEEPPVHPVRNPASVEQQHTRALRDARLTSQQLAVSALH